MADRNVVPWLDGLARALAHDGRAVLVVVAGAQGPTPRETGTAMIVSAVGCIGTIGGGHLEYEAARLARDALLRSGSPATWIVRYPLAARVGQACGGVATLAFSKLDHSAHAWLEPALACARTGAPFAIVSRAGGDDDRAMRLVVTGDDVRGTLGDVGADSAAIALARTRLAGARAGAALVRSTHGGPAQLLIQVERPDAFPILLFGNGHVGRALVEVLGVVPARVRWIDSRAADFPAAVPGNVETVVSDTPQAELHDAPPGAFVVVTTHSHQLDFALIETALARDDWRYLGLIGSKAKRAELERQLAAHGFAPEDFARIRCPIGTEGVAIRSKHPGAIAIAIAAELLAVREAAARGSDAGHGIAVVPRR
ncbi:MAG TPA: xanthine dehydrogenase accessory protein XdhC [Casimicrobiaceae bacterium]